MSSSIGGRPDRIRADSPLKSDAEEFGNLKEYKQLVGLAETLPASLHEDVVAIKVSEELARMEAQTELDPDAALKELSSVLPRDTPATVEHVATPVISHVETTETVKPSEAAKAADTPKVKVLKMPTRARLPEMEIPDYPIKGADANVSKIASDASKALEPAEGAIGYSSGKTKEGQGSSEMAEMVSGTTDEVLAKLGAWLKTEEPAESQPKAGGVSALQEDKQGLEPVVADKQSSNLQVRIGRLDSNTGEKKLLKGLKKLTAAERQDIRDNGADLIAKMSTGNKGPGNQEFLKEGLKRLEASDREKLELQARADEVIKGAAEGSVIKKMAELTRSWGTKGAVVVIALGSLLEAADKAGSMISTPVKNLFNSATSRSAASAFSEAGVVKTPTTPTPGERRVMFADQQETSSPAEPVVAATIAVFDFTSENGALVKSALSEVFKTVKRDSGRPFLVMAAQIYNKKNENPEMVAAFKELLNSAGFEDMQRLLEFMEKFQNLKIELQFLKDTDLKLKFNQELAFDVLKIPEGKINESKSLPAFYEILNEHFKPILEDLEQKMK